MRTPGNKPEDELRAASRDVRRAHRIRTGKATTVLIDVDRLREVLLHADEATFRALTGHLGEHTARAVCPGRELAEVSA